MKTNGSQNIVLATADGMAICFSENDVRVMGRDAAGVRGIACPTATNLGRRRALPRKESSF